MALAGLLLLGLGAIVDRWHLADPGAELTVLADDGRGHCTVRWTDPLDERVRRGTFACDPGRDPLLSDREYGFEASHRPWRGDLYNAEGAGTSEDDVATGACLAGLALLLVAAVGGAVRIRGSRRARTVVTLRKDVAAPGYGPDRPRGAAVRPLVKPVLLVAGGALALTLSGAFFWVELPHARQQERDFRAAAPCSPVSAATGVTGADCLSTERFTVTQVHIRGGRRSSYTADLTGPGSAVAESVRFDDDLPLLRELRSGDPVRGTRWRGDIVAVSSVDGRTRQATSADPTGGTSGVLLGAILLGVVGAGLASAGGISAYRVRAGVRTERLGSARTAAPAG